MEGGIVRRRKVIGHCCARIILVLGRKIEQNDAKDHVLSLLLSRLTRLAEAYNAYRVPAYSSSNCSPNLSDAGNQPGMGRLKTTFHLHGLFDSSWPSLLSSTASLGTNSCVIEQRRSGAYPNSEFMTSDWPSKVTVRDWRKRRMVLRPESNREAVGEIEMDT